MPSKFPESPTHWSKPRLRRSECQSDQRQRLAIAHHARDNHLSSPHAHGSSTSSTTKMLYETIGIVRTSIASAKKRSQTTG
jgi:hypothetical protein